MAGRCLAHIGGDDLELPPPMKADEAIPCGLRPDEIAACLMRLDYLGGRHEHPWRFCRGAHLWILTAMVGDVKEATGFVRAMAGPERAGGIAMAEVVERSRGRS